MSFCKRHNLLSRSVIHGFSSILLVYSFLGMAASAEEAVGKASEPTSVNQMPYQAPKWAIEIKGGLFYPDLDDYELFYGSDNNGFWGLNAAYRFTNWMELGGEIGYSSDNGRGVLPGSGTLGGAVKYTVVPLQLFLNFRYDRSPNQLFVPYAGLGVVSSWYKLQIDQQSDRDGFSDIGPAGRAGVQVLLNRLDSRGADYVSGQRRFKSFLFLEAQYLKTEKDDFDLGGKAYLLGLRFEFDGY